MNSESPAPANQWLQMSSMLEPLDQLGVLSNRIQVLFERGLITNDVSLIHDAGNMLATFTAFGTQHGLFAKMTDHLVEISKTLPFERTLINIQLGSVSSDVFEALFHYVSPRMSQLGELIERAHDTVPAALHAMLRNGLVRQREVDELATRLHLIPDNLAFTMLLEYKLEGLRSGTSDYFNVPYLVSDYFSEVGLPANLRDAGALGQFLIRELPALTAQAVGAETARNSGQANLFSIDALELFANSGFKQEASAMAAFYLGFNPNDDRHMSRLAQLGHGEVMLQKLVAAVGTQQPITTAQVNFALESPLVSNAQFCALLCIDSSRLAPGAIMEGLGHAFSVYEEMEETQQQQLIDKVGFAFDRFIELLDPMPPRWRNELVEGLINVFYNYESLDPAAKAIVQERSILTMSHCLKRLDNNPNEQVALQRKILDIEHLPRTLWEAVDWMHTHSLEADLGL
ncbi:hypothetical protein DV532_28725 (plasmid) [Pseudomonas sp. Leaf58]|uniref:hypothetical protein n=1 Tax=Pseudomonas sp. Leaf58 TaxID=1736226 RepID=UPI0006F5FDE3|nr:hypothetical protein [Pseudomonas sp. Leaf58]AYG48252.1 hypothetical protein DV532_28725 [Pseudomonas sp. Leaf58]KQN62200.1 hypothetical protein ASF02_08535 [Pseudomonas sp. Leaf58]